MQNTSKKKKRHKSELNEKVHKISQPFAENHNKLINRKKKQYKKNGTC